MENHLGKSLQRNLHKKKTGKRVKCIQFLSKPQQPVKRCVQKRREKREEEEGEIEIK